MPWSKSVLKKNEAQKVVLDFTPHRFDLGTPNQALEYLQSKKHGSDFEMSEAIRQKTGIDQLEEATHLENVELKALEKLKEIQEQAYKEGYQLGLDEGRTKAYEQNNAVIQEKLKTFDEIIVAISKMKTDFVIFNENHVVELLFHMSEKIAQQELERNNEAVIKIIQNAVALAQDEEDISVKISASQFEFIEEAKKRTGREFEFLKKVKFEPSPDLKPGGCLVETNFGEVDARIAQRLQLLWDNLKENMPKLKTKLEG